jgi:hypothetical protein
VPPDFTEPEFSVILNGSNGERYACDQNDNEKTHRETEDEAWKAIKEMQRNLGGINNALGERDN